MVISTYYKRIKSWTYTCRRIARKKQMYVENSKKNEVYIFKDYDEYRRFFLMDLDNIEDDVII